MVRLHAFRLRRSLGLHPQEREDLQQDLRLELLRQLANYNPCRGTFRAFVWHRLRFIGLRLFHRRVTDKRHSASIRSMEQNRFRSANSNESDWEATIDRRLDLQTIFDSSSPELAQLASKLMTCTVTETARNCQQSRSTLYRPPENAPQTTGSSWL
jgi:hypothetical protein